MRTFIEVIETKDGFFVQGFVSLKGLDIRLDQVVCDKNNRKTGEAAIALTLREACPGVIPSARGYV